MSNDAMKPDMTPEEEDEAADHHRERLKCLGELAPPTDLGEARARNREKEELERRLREHDERKRARESIGVDASMTVRDVIDTYLAFRANLGIAQAASQTMTSCSIEPSQLVDAFNAGILDFSRSSVDADSIHRRRNELLSHFNSKN